MLTEQTGYRIPFNFKMVLQLDDLSSMPKILLLRPILRVTIYNNLYG